MIDARRFIILIGGSWFMRVFWIAHIRLAQGGWELDRIATYQLSSVGRVWLIVYSREVGGMVGSFTGLGTLPVRIDSVECDVAEWD